MKFFKNVKIIYDSVAITKAFMKLCVKDIQERRFPSSTDLDAMMARVNKNYSSTAQEYVSELPNPSLALRMSFFTHTLIASAVFHLKGNYESSNSIATYYLNNMASDTENAFKDSIIKAVTANNLRLVLLEKETSGMTEKIKEDLEVIKAHLFSNKTGTGGHLGEIALCYFLMDNKEEATNQLIERVAKDKGNVEKSLDEIYENPGLSHTKIGQEYFTFIENFVASYVPDVSPAKAPSLKP